MELVLKLLLQVAHQRVCGLKEKRLISGIHKRHLYLCCTGSDGRLHPPWTWRESSAWLTCSGHESRCLCLTGRADKKADRRGHVEELSLDSISSCCFFFFKDLTDDQMPRVKCRTFFPRVSKAERISRPRTVWACCSCECRVLWNWLSPITFWVRSRSPAQFSCVGSRLSTERKCSKSLTTTHNYGERRTIGDVFGVYHAKCFFFPAPGLPPYHVDGPAVVGLLRQHPDPLLQRVTVVLWVRLCCC